MRRRTRAILEDLHLGISPDAPADSLPAAHRQFLQVARALAFDCRILVLDEPTTSLTDAETDHLFTVLARLRQRGTTVLYVSHRLPEVFRLCDRITVLRDGEHVGTWIAPRPPLRASSSRWSGATCRRVARPPFALARAEPALTVSGLWRRPGVHGVNLRVGAGEIVGLFGLVGSGRSELLETLFGLYRRDAGDVFVGDQKVDPRTPRAAARVGLALVPEERQRQGLLYNLSVRSNLVLPSRTVGGAVRIRRTDERRQAEALAAAWRIKTAGVEALPDSLSGGNQQKIVVAKWLATEPRVLLLDEPTKGVDVAAKFEIHEIVRREAARGVGCLVASSDLPEVIALADRILVMREGRIQGELAGATATEEAVMQLATHDPGGAA